MAVNAGKRAQKAAHVQGEKRKPGSQVILLLPPGFTVGNTIQESLKIHGLTQFEEIEPKAGCRRFRLY